jgi:hypothetical protein
MALAAIRTCLAFGIAAVVLSVASGVATGKSTAFVQFHTPSGNIHCGYGGFSGEPPFLRCDIFSGLGRSRRSREAATSTGASGSAWAEREWRDCSASATRSPTQRARTRLRLRPDLPPRRLHLRPARVGADLHESQPSRLLPEPRALAPLLAVTAFLQRAPSDRVALYFPRRRRDNHHIAARHLNDEPGR